MRKTLLRAAEVLQQPPALYSTRSVRDSLLADAKQLHVHREQQPDASSLAADNIGLTDARKQGRAEQFQVPGEPVAD